MIPMKTPGLRITKEFISFVSRGKWQTAEDQEQEIELPCVVRCDKLSQPFKFTEYYLWFNLQKKPRN